MIGDIITIYYDPITQQDPEGKARITGIQRVNQDFYFYRVKFCSDNFKAIRKVKR